MTDLALLGCAHIHTPDFIDRLNRRDDIRVSVVWDHDASRSRAAAEKLAARRADDYREVLSVPDIAGVIICSETVHHEDLVNASVEAKKHLFVEKPLGFASSDAKRMAARIAGAGLVFQTGYFKRSDPAHRFLKTQVDKGHFGRVTRARYANCHAGALKGWFDSQWRWMADPALAGRGAFGDLGAHALDSLLWFFGEVDRLTAALQVVTGRYGDCDESGEGLLIFKNGVTATLAAGWVDLVNPVSLVISGTEGHAHILNHQLYFKSEHVSGADGETPWQDLPEPLPHAFDLYLDALTGQRRALVTVAEAAYENVVMEALYQSAEVGVWLEPGSL